MASGSHYRQGTRNERGDHESDQTRHRARGDIARAAFLLQGNFATPAAAEQVPGGEPLSKTYRVTRAKDVEFQKIAPFKVFDNLYYVGPGYVSVWLLTTPQGDILFDSAQEPYVDHVIANIRKVGVDLKDIKYILLSHGHLDHFGGAARIQELSGARVGALEEDWKMIEQVGSKPAQDGSPPPRVPKRDMVFKEGDTLVLGDQTLKFHQHPGHTPGVLSTEGITVYDGGKPYKAFVWEDRATAAESPRQNKPWGARRASPKSRVSR